jgi:hypothetical protein
MDSMMNVFRIVLVINMVLSAVHLRAQTSGSPVSWFLDRTDSIGGFPASALKRVPQPISTPYGAALLFSWKDSTALLVNTNPLGSDTAFTIEVFFRPDSTLLSGTNNEQRFLHIRNAANDNRRILLETRVLANQRWLLDSFIKSDNSNLTLVDSNTSFSISAWHHVAMTYGSGLMKQYVDGNLILSGGVKYLPIDLSPRTSIGSRQDPRSWFNGAIRMVKFTKRVLSPQEFTFPTIVGVGENNTIPIKFELFQNYPNPFNPSTIIAFTLLEGSPVKLEVFDMTGREVGVLVNGYMQAGTSTVEFKAPHVSSGLYVYRLTLDGQASSKKMLFIK